MREHWNHTLVGLIWSAVHLQEIMIQLYLVIKMMDLVAFVEYVTHHFRWWGVDNGRRYDIGHISVILILGYFQLRVGVELADGCKMYIAPVKVSKLLLH